MRSLHQSARQSNSGFHLPPSLPSLIAHAFRVTCPHRQSPPHLLTSVSQPTTLQITADVDSSKPAKVEAALRAYCKETKIDKEGRFVRDLTSPHLSPSLSRSA